MTQQESGHLKEILEEIIASRLSADGLEWLRGKAHSTAQLTTAFISIPRKTGKNIVALSASQQQALNSARPGFCISGWTIDRLSRVWLLSTLDFSDKAKYIITIENLFPAAEVNELIALYSALPVLEYAESWAGRCSEGIRSNIGDVLLAIMCNNPYPSENLTEAAWNQLVLKAFFTEKPINKIIGIDTRANERLAKTLSDYAHERWAAHRSVNPQLWRCTGKFIDKDLFEDIEKLSLSDNLIDREAAALACHDSNYPPAIELLNRFKTIQSAINSGALTWNKLAEKTADYVLQQ
jgi:hypothetical protein